MPRGLHTYDMDERLNRIRLEYSDSGALAALEMAIQLNSIFTAEYTGLCCPESRAPAGMGTRIETSDDSGR